MRGRELEDALTLVFIRGPQVIAQCGVAPRRSVISNSRISQYHWLLEGVWVGQVREESR